MPSHYDKLFQISKEAALFSSIQQLLEWDQETYMPHDAISIRSQQLELLASLIHKQKTSPKFQKALASLINLETGKIVETNLTEQQKSALREWRRDFMKSKKLPQSFVKKFAKTTSESLHAWSLAKKESSFKSFAPHLEKIVSLLRKKADLLGYREHPYDALLDLYEPDMTVRELNPLFGRLKISLMSLLKTITAKPAKNEDFLKGHFESDKQLHFSHFILKKMGFDANSSRLDLSMHPFCMGIHPKDLRMTTHINTEHPMGCLFAVIHEGGHGLYHIGLPEKYFGSPLCESASLGIDESQSRWWETRIGHSYPFWQYFYPLLQKEFPAHLNGVYLDDFYRAINSVKPSLIRIHADEVTYSLHVILRYEIEKSLIEGTLKSKEVPEAWNAKMREFLGIVPKGDAEGCLQDIHWSMGAIGYFPTYTLGNLYAAQFFNTFEAKYPHWKELVAQGELGFIREWLKDQIHQYGREFTPTALIKRVSEEPLSEKPYINYLETKYHKLYPN